MQFIKGLAALALVISVSGCMSNDGERALAGAVAGAVVADVLDTNVVAGAAIGAAAGALCDDAGLAPCTN
jgi:osmotically inducible lipoprotein OsmB